MMHIMERFVIHFAAGTFLLLAVFFALRYWERHNCKVGNWISGRHSHLLVTSALVVFGLMMAREAFDTALATQIWYKAIFDQISWCLGTAAGAWGLYRFRKTE